MSDPDVATVSEAFALYRGGHIVTLFDRLVDPSVELRTVYSCHSCLGRANVQRVIERLAKHENWQAVGLRMERAGEHVLVSGRLELIAESGVPMELPVAWLFTVTGGKIARMASFIDRRAALSAAAGPGTAPLSR